MGPFDLDSVEVVQYPGKLVGEVFRLKRKENKVNTRSLETPLSLFASIFFYLVFICPGQLACILHLLLV